MRGAARTGLSRTLIAIVTIGLGCARDNPEFGLGADGGGTAGSSTGRQPVGNSGVMSTADATGATSSDHPMATTSSATTDPTKADSSTSDGSVDSGGVSDTSDGETCDATPCQPYANGCPDGFKCTLVDGDGDGSFEQVVCSELVSPTAQELDLCTFGTCGHDDCAAGLACVSPGRDTGVCRALCHETLAPCGDPDQLCVEEVGQIGLCRQGCQPLLQDCPNGEACFIRFEAGEAVCAADNPMHEGGVACETYNDCAQGFHCTPSALLGDCPNDAPRCCAPQCDTLDPTACQPVGTCVSAGVAMDPEAGICVD